MKIKRNVGLVFFLIIGSFLFSCKTNHVVEKPVIKEVNYIPYYLEMYKADSLYLIDNFEGSYKILDSLFKIYPPVETDNYAEYSIYLTSAVMSGHLQEIDRKVKFGYTHFGGISTLHKKYSELRQAVNKAANLSEDNIKNLKQAYYISLNLELRKKMLQMFKEDQAIRQNDIDYSKMDTIDEKNRKDLNQIFKHFGYPRKELIGHSSAYDLPDGDIRVGILFLHQPDSVRAKYLPILLQEVKKGNCSPTIYAQLYDRDLTLRGENQYFGTYNCGDDVVCTLSNPKKIDSIRRSIGLPRIKYYPWRVKQFQQE